jgi:Ca2+/Na+ antiporter
MTDGSDEPMAEGRVGPVGKIFLILTLIAALFLLYHAVWFAITMIELAHDVPSPWTVSDFSLMALPVALLAIVLAAIFALVRGRLEPLWLSLTFLLAVVVVVVATFD